VINVHTARQHPTATNRNFRSLALPRRNSNIGTGSVAVNHSSSVIGVPSAAILPAAAVAIIFFSESAREQRRDEAAERPDLFGTPPQVGAERGNAVNL
jgi:hypothetical protein